MRPGTLLLTAFVAAAAVGALPHDSRDIRAPNARAIQGPTPVDLREFDGDGPTAREMNAKPASLFSREDGHIDGQTFERRSRIGKKIGEFFKKAFHFLTPF
ncbi:hypothetical protein FISHEDRAFT_72941 [Fistulina hepatica ATCC 64428]|uniref:Uncharacterized protein n=1 Tax=Fistulina hepatica ATCC 64428 TaxID=1128425 RepID=A0A0D7ADR9_9AGAR|nr:hypothetical protein FISHEDRAFT_72941 [Fistulina hepatica ATCC 64428]